MRQQKIQYCPHLNVQPPLQVLVGRLTVNQLVQEGPDLPAVLLVQLEHQNSIKDRSAQRTRQVQNTKAHLQQEPIEIFTESQNQDRVQKVHLRDLNTE